MIRDKRGRIPTLVLLFTPKGYALRNQFTGAEIPFGDRRPTTRQLRGAAKQLERTAPHVPSSS